MSNSPLVSYTKLSPNHSGRRNHVIDTISIHCMAGNGSVETCGALFADPARKASSNYGIGSDTFFIFNRADDRFDQFIHKNPLRVYNLAKVRKIIRI